MARLQDLSFKIRLFMKAYPYRSVDWSPGAGLSKPLHAARLALITSSALHLPDDPAFDAGIRGGDCSYRELPATVDVQKLRMEHHSSSFDHSGVLQDKNLAFPLDRLRELVERGELGSLNHRHFSFLGSITAPGRLISQTAPEVARKLVHDQVDAVLLVPVWPMCNQSVGLIASVLEKAGIPTVSLSLLREVTERVKPPRSLFVPFPLGYPLGQPDQPELQHRVLGSALELFAWTGPLPVLKDLRLDGAYPATSEGAMRR